MRVVVFALTVLEFGFLMMIVMLVESLVIVVVMFDSFWVVMFVISMIVTFEL